MLPKRYPLLWDLLLLLLQVLLMLLVLLVLWVLQEQGRVIGRAGSKAIHYYVMASITDSDIIQKTQCGSGSRFPAWVPQTDLPQFLQ